MHAPTRRDLATTLRRITRNDHLLLVILALVIGTAAAYGAIAFRELYLLIQFGGFGTWSEALADDVAALPWWRIILIPTLGGLIVGLFVQYAMPGRRPQGVADVIGAVALRSGRMSETTGIKAAFVSAASIGTGASVGREGPVVHLGAFMASWVAARLRLSRSQSVTLLGCGVASAVSASFNAPIAGAFFALEVVIGHYGLSAFAPIVLASVCGTIISRIHFGNFPAFILPDHTIVSFLEFPAFVLLGIVSALMAIILLRSIAFTQTVVERTGVPQWSRPMVAGLIIGLIALVYPQVLGVGYGSTDAALKELIPLHLLLALLVAKTAATAICLGSGFGGGIFSPGLFIGAMLGGAFGIVATSVFPDHSSGHGAYTLVGMGAVAGSVLGAPISTILVVFELTADYALTVAVMVGVVIASLLTQQLHGLSFFTWQLERWGINLHRGRERGLVASIHVGDVMRSEYVAIPLGLGMAEVREKLLTAPYGELFVVQDNGSVFGTITLSDLSNTAFDTSLDTLLNAADVARQHPPVLERGESVETALNLMQESGEEHIGVVDNRKDMNLIGFVHEVDVILAYNRALLQARREERGEA